MSIVSSQAFERPQPNNMVRVYYVHTDSVGVEHETSIQSLASTYDKVANLSNSVSVTNQSLIDLENTSFLDQISMGINPYRDASNNVITPNHQSYYASVTAVLRAIASISDPHEFARYHLGAAFLSNLTDAEKLAVFPELTLIDINAWQKRLSDVDLALSGYYPLLKDF